jgi:HAMP domain-containing protein
MKTTLTPLMDTLDSKQLLKVLTAFKKGDFSARMPVDQAGLAGKINDTLNEIIEMNDKMTREFDRISRAVGKEGKITQRAAIGVTGGAWAECVDAVNSLIGDLVQPSTEVARVIGAVAKGDLTQTMALEVEGRPLRGEFLRTARVVNTMVDQLNSFGSHPRGARSGYGRKAGRSGGSERRRRHMERSHRVGELHGQQPHQSGTKYRRCHNGCGERRFDDENHGRRSRRNFGTQEHHQHDGGSAQLVCIGSHARGARSRQ